MIPLQLLTSYDDAHRSEILTVVQEAVDLGVPYIQFCWKGTDLETFTLAEKLKHIVSKSDSKLIVNNRLDIALAIEADGLHVGQDDIPLPILTKLMPDNMQLGFTISTVEQLREAEQHHVDFYGIGPVFNTKTKPGAPLGIEKIKQFRTMTNRPIVAIGGINVDNAKSLFDIGVDGIAVIGSVYDSTDRQKTIKDLMRISNG
mgnify:FL=1